MSENVAVCAESGRAMTAPPHRWVRSADWERIVALIGLQPGALPADVIVALEARVPKTGPPAPGDRAAAIEACGRCDPYGWVLDADRVPADPARRCDHNTTSARPVRDVTEPVHESPRGRW